MSETLSKALRLTFCLGSFVERSAWSPFLKSTALNVTMRNPSKPVASSALSFQLDDRDQFARWERIHDVIASGEMPPERARPDAGAGRAVLAELSANLTGVDEERQRREGRTGLRRLSRGRVSNTLRDLLALPALRVAHELPADGKAHGFDRSPARWTFRSFIWRTCGGSGRALDAAMLAFVEKPPVFTDRWYPWSTTVIGTLTGFKEAIGLIRHDAG